MSLKHAGSDMGRCTQIYIPRDPLFGAGRASYNVSGTSCKLLDEDVTSYQERLASYLKKMLQRIRNIWQVTWRRCYNVSGTSCKLLEEDVTTYQQRLASYLKKMLQPIRNVLQITVKKMLQRSRKSLLTTQTTGRCYTPLKTPSPKPPPKKTMYKSDNSPAPRGAPSPKTCAFDFEKRDSTAETKGFNGWKPIRHGDLTNKNGGI